MVIITDRLLAHFQNNWALFDLADYFTDTKRKHDDRFENYIDAMIDRKDKTLYDATSITDNDVQAQLIIRSLSDDELESLLRDNEVDIKGVNVEPLYNYGDILRYALPSEEDILLELLTPIYEDDCNGTPIDIYYTLPIECAEQQPMHNRTKIGYIRKDMYPATKEDILYFRLVSLFQRYGRDFGEFKNGDLFYVKEEDFIFSYYDQDTVTLLHKIIEGEVKFLETRENVVEDYFEKSNLLG